MEKTFPLPNVSSRQALFRELEAYAGTRSAELESAGRLKHELVKSYLLETLPGGLTERDLSDGFRESRWNLEPIDDGLFIARDSDGVGGYLERLDKRHLVFYTTEPSDQSDRAVARLASRSTYIDRLWFSSALLLALWEIVSAAHDARRFVRMRFEFDDLFGVVEPDEPIETELEIARALERATERRGSVFALTERIGRAKSRLPEFQKIEDAFLDLTLLRLPSTAGRGGHDLYYTGKVTNNSQVFLEHRQQLVFLVDAYRRVIEQVEETARMRFAVAESESGGGARLTGAPIVFTFADPIRSDVFENFIHITFDQNRGPFRILGKPIRVGPKAVHVYGVDMHLWQEVWLSVTPTHWTLVLPGDACGNTVSRFLTNIQRYISPRVKATVAGRPIEEIAVRALSGQPIAVNS